MKAFFSSLTGSYIDYWKRAFALKGRTSRINFWSAFLVDIIISVILFVAFTGLLWRPLTDDTDLGIIAGSSWPLFIWQVINVIPRFTMEVRRVRDAGAKSWVLVLTGAGLINSVMRILYPQTYPAAKLFLGFIRLFPFAYTVAPSFDRKTSYEAGS